MIRKIETFIYLHLSFIKHILALLVASVGALNTQQSSLLFEDHKLFIFLKDLISPYSLWLYLSATVVYVILYIVDHKQKPKLKRLSKENEKLLKKCDIMSERIRDLFDGYLYNLASKLEFGKNDRNCERITLYIHDEEESSFIPFGRYSANPKYKTLRRTSYPDNQGVIGIGWNHGWHYDNGMPCPTAAQSKYVDYCLKEHKLPRNTCKKLNMKSRLYSALAIHHNKCALAVLVVESETPDRFSENEIKKLLEGQQKYLGETIKCLKEYIPTPDTAGKKGF